MNNETNTNNQPLTLEELIDNSGEPLWFTSLRDTPYDDFPHWFICCLNKLPDNWYNYGKTWVAYAKKQ